MTINFAPNQDSGANHQNQFNSGDDNQQVQAHGDVTGPVIGRGGIHIGDGNSGITITSIASPGRPKRTFEIKKKTRVPVSSAAVGTVASALAIVSFATGATSIADLVGRIQQGGIAAASTAPTGWLFGAAVLFAVAMMLFALVRFLRRHVLWVPKSSLLPAWAGLKEQSGRTFPYALRLAMKCPSCSNEKLRFKQVPTRFNEIIDLRSGKLVKRTPAEWTPMAACRRYEEHNIPLDLADNDFDVATKRRGAR